jgi:hypothetical protein
MTRSWRRVTLLLIGIVVLCTPILRADNMVWVSTTWSPVPLDSKTYLTINFAQTGNWTSQDFLKASILEWDGNTSANPAMRIDLILDTPGVQPNCTCAVITATVFFDGNTGKNWIHYSFNVTDLLNPGSAYFIRLSFADYGNHSINNNLWSFTGKFGFVSVSNTPEPATLTLFATGAVGLLGGRRLLRRKKS